MGLTVELEDYWWMTYCVVLAKRLGIKVQTQKYRVLVENFTNQIILLLLKPFVTTPGAVYWRFLLYLLRTVLGEAHNGENAFADSLEAFGGGYDDPVSVSVGGCWNFLIYCFTSSSLYKLRISYGSSFVLTEELYFRLVGKY